MLMNPRGVTLWWPRAGVASWLVTGLADQTPGLPCSDRLLHPATVPIVDTNPGVCRDDERHDI